MSCISRHLLAHFGRPNLLVFSPKNIKNVSITLCWRQQQSYYSFWQMDDRASRANALLGPLSHCRSRHMRRYYHRSPHSLQRRSNPEVNRPTHSTVMSSEHPMQWLSASDVPWESIWKALGKYSESLWKSVEYRVYGGVP
jgi:hypothetical protein